MSLPKIGYLIRFNQNEYEIECISHHMFQLIFNFLHKLVIFSIIFNVTIKQNLNVSISQ